MPSADTFTIHPIAQFIDRHLSGHSVDPFARNSKLADVTNDLNPNTSAQFHQDAIEFLSQQADGGGKFNSALIDPPYSPRQVAECYQSAGLAATMADTQNARLYADIRRELERLIVPGGVVLWFGWNSTGMGRAWELLEILIVCHGGAHNDTICTAHRKPFGIFDSLVR